MTGPLDINTTEPIRIGYSLSLSGPAVQNTKAVRVAHHTWETDINSRGGLLGRKVVMICIDDQGDASKAAKIYNNLIDDLSIDLVIGGYGINTITASMPVIIQHRRFLIGLISLGANGNLHYPNYFSVIGPKNKSLKTELGPLLNGFVNFENWIPVPKMDFPEIADMFTKHHAQVNKKVDALRYYVAPLAYSQMQVLEQAVTATGSLQDDVLSQYCQENDFYTVIGTIRFDKNGEWESSHVLQVQVQNIENEQINTFLDNPKEMVISPHQYISGHFIFPYAPWN